MSTKHQLNDPDVWMNSFPVGDDAMNKYDRGHAVVLAAAELIGATRLSASAALRIGAGLVTVLSNVSTTAYRIALPPDIMVKEGCLQDLSHVNTVLGGPGGICESYRDMLMAVPSQVTRVMDAAALSEDIKGEKLGVHTVLTPHDGEFRRFFDATSGTRAELTLKAAKKAECVIVRKGPQTIIAHPDGRIVVNDAPNFYLAKAGSGDVLAGFLTGLLALKMPAFEAACAAVWIHSDAGFRLGPGLTAADLEYSLPEILRDILNV